MQASSSAPPAPPALPPLAPSPPHLPPVLPPPPSQPSMAPTNITFRVNTIGPQFQVNEWEIEPIKHDKCCYVVGDFNSWGFSDRYRMYDDDGDGVYEATIEIPAPIADAFLWSPILEIGEEKTNLLESNRWAVLNSTSYYRYKVATLGWDQQEVFGIVIPLPADVSCLLGPTWNGVRHAP